MQMPFFQESATSAGHLPLSRLATVVSSHLKRSLKPRRRLMKGACPDLCIAGLPLRMKASQGPDLMFMPSKVASNKALL